MCRADTLFVGSHFCPSSASCRGVTAVALSSLSPAVVCSVWCLLDTSPLCLFIFTNAALRAAADWASRGTSGSGGAHLHLLGFDAPSPCAGAHEISISVCIVWSVADSFLLASHCLHWAGCVPGEVSCSCRVADLRCPELVSLCLRQVTRLRLRLRRHGFLMALHDEPEPVCSASAASTVAASRSFPDLHPL